MTLEKKTDFKKKTKLSPKNKTNSIFFFWRKTNSKKKNIIKSFALLFNRILFFRSFKISPGIFCKKIKFKFFDTEMKISFFFFLRCFSFPFLCVYVNMGKSRKLRKLKSNFPRHIFWCCFIQSIVSYLFWSYMTAWCNFTWCVASKLVQKRWFLTLLLPGNPFFPSNFEYNYGNFFILLYRQLR